MPIFQSLRLFLGTKGLWVCWRRKYNAFWRMSEWFGVRMKRISVREKYKMCVLLLICNFPMNFSPSRHVFPMVRGGISDIGQEWVDSQKIFFISLFLLYHLELSRHFSPFGSQHTLLPFRK